jgi:hypothetical protein
VSLNIAPFFFVDDQSLPDELALIEAFQKMIERLPLPNQFLLLYILDMLSLFALNSKSHRMDASNLAAVFAPVRKRFT